MQEITLPVLLKQAREDRSYNEMARRCKLAVATIQRIETGAVELPNRDTLLALSRGYGIDIDKLALAAYGRLFEEVPEDSDVTGPLETAPPADSVGSEQEWSQTTTGQKLRRVTAST